MGGVKAGSGKEDEPEIAECADVEGEDAVG